MVYIQLDNMSLFYEIVGLTIAVADLVLTIIWIVKFPKYVKKLALNYPNDNSSDKKQIEKKFINQVAKLLIISFPSCVLCSILTFLDLNNNAYNDPYLVPVIVLICCLFGYFLIILYIYIIRKKYKLDYQRIAPVIILSAYLFSVGMALGTYMLMRLISLI